MPAVHWWSASQQSFVTVSVALENSTKSLHAIEVGTPPPPPVSVDHEEHILCAPLVVGPLVPRRVGVIRARHNSLSRAVASPAARFVPAVVRVAVHTDVDGLSRLELNAEDGLVACTTARHLVVVSRSAGVAAQW